MTESCGIEQGDLRVVRVEGTAQVLGIASKQHVLILGIVKRNKFGAISAR